MDNLSFKELRALIDKQTSGKLPKAQTLKNSDEEILISFQGATVYKSGFFLFEENGNSTVFVLDNFRFVQKDEENYYQQNELDELDWFIPVLLLGTSRIDENKSDWVWHHTDYYFDDEEHLEKDEPFTSFEEDLFKRYEKEEHVNLLHDSIKYLSPREQDVINCKLAGMEDQSEIADFLGVSQQRVSDLQRSAIKKFQKIFADRGCMTP